MLGEGERRQCHAQVAGDIRRKKKEQEGHELSSQELLCVAADAESSAVDSGHGAH